MFKQTIGWYLVIVSHDGNGFENRAKINERLLDLPKESIDAPVGQLHAAWSERMAPPPAEPSAPVRDTPARPAVGRKMA